MRTQTPLSERAEQHVGGKSPAETLNIGINVTGY